MELCIVHYNNELNGSIQCPKCHCGNLHHVKVEIFSRQEDKGEVFNTVFSKGTQISIDKILEASDNPSSRREGLKIWFTCENCDLYSALNVVQHKGETLLYWDDIS
ncbi:MAG: hypothetical protein LBP22_07985 [Deltaproteobacteria bacterium]|jgi:hypothetical protein|nr:hypothetical protein [Deltaproteobacteria bacterium]